MAPLTTSCGLSSGITLWPEAAEDFQSQKNSCTSSYLRIGTKKALTVISNGAKCLTSHAGRISGHLKTPMVCIHSLPKSSLEAQAKQRKGKKMKRKWTMRECK